MQDIACAYLDAAADSDQRRLSWCGGDGDGAYLVVKAIVVSIINNKVEDISHWLTSRLYWSDVPADGNLF